MSQNPFENVGEQIRPLIADEFAIDSVTTTRDGGALQFVGDFIGESGAAFARIQSRLRALDLMALAQRERARVQLIVVKGLPVERPWPAVVNVILLLLTIVTTTLVGAQYEQTCQGIVGGRIGLDFLNEPLRLLAGLPFSLGVLAILGTHELGHYFTARKYHIAVTLPYFIPVPIGLGTLGAFIKLKAPIDSRKSLFDVGIAGPLAGLVVALPVFIGGLLLSQVRPCGQAVYGNSLFVNALTLLVHGTHARGWILIMHPLAYAGWVGFLMTGINLLPVGQLDGGHVTYAIFGRYAGWIARATFGGMLLLSLIYPGWFIWALLIFFVGLRHPPPLNDVTPLDPRRRALGIATMLFALLIIVPVPFNVRGLF
ncbi:MAG: site-2 protease family protein [Chloroflexota bacterium]